MQIKTTSALLFLGLAIAACATRADDKWDISKLDAGKLPASSDKKELTFAKDIRPLLETACFRCHGEQKQMGRLRLDTLEAVLKGGEDGKVVVPGDSKKSLLVFAVAQVDDSIAMPPKKKGGGPGGPGSGGTGNRSQGGPGGGNPPAGGPGGFGSPKAFSPEQVGLIRAWIDQNAK